MGSNTTILSQAEYQDFITRSAFYPHANTGDHYEINYIMLGLGGEAGEAVDVWKKIVRDMGVDDNAVLGDPLYHANDHAVDLAYELSDIMWYLTHALRILDMSHGQLMFLNAMKLWKRHGGEWPFSNLSQEQAEESEQRIIDNLRVYGNV